MMERMDWSGCDDRRGTTTAWQHGRIGGGGGGGGDDGTVDDGDGGGGGGGGGKE